MNKHQQLEKTARKLALESLNKNRSEKNLPPLQRLERLWWKMYKQEWLDKADQLLNTTMGFRSCPQ